LKRNEKEEEKQIQEEIGEKCILVYFLPYARVVYLYARKGTSVHRRLPGGCLSAIYQEMAKNSTGKSYLEFREREKQGGN